MDLAARGAVMTGEVATRSRVRIGRGAVLLLALVALAIGAPWFGLPETGAPGLPPLGLSGAEALHPLGTDPGGTDLTLRVAAALSVTILVVGAALAGQVLLCLLLVLAGAALRPLRWGISGLARVMHAVSLPFLALAGLLLAEAMEVLPASGWPRLAFVTIALILAGWPRGVMEMNRMLERVRQAPHVRAAREIRLPPHRLWLRHMLPGTNGAMRRAAPLIAVETLAAALAIGFLRPAEDLPNLGGMIAQTAADLPMDWTPFLVASIAAGLLLLALAMLSGESETGP
ncbi:MAG: hypothetical protein AAFR17_14390 [Pseudomonadota bacterium]